MNIPPQLIPKYATTLTKDMEDRIISMYTKGMITGDIESHMKVLYGVNISYSTKPYLSSGNGRNSRWRRSILSYIWTPSTTMSEVKTKS